MRKTIQSAFVSAFALLFATGAHADPQMLGVVTTASAVPLHCAGGECSAELTSICLHEQRPTPTEGYPYTPHNADAVRLTGVRADGSVVPLDAGKILRFAAARGFTTVKVSASDNVLMSAGVVSVAVRVERPLTLVPDGRGPSQAKPLTASDIELGAGPLRATAASIVDGDTDTMHASQALARLVDVLPRHGKAPAEVRTTAWGTAVAPERSRLSATGLHRARTTYNRCYRQTRIGDKTLRGCLAEAHDQFVRDLNTKYWDAVKAGS